MPNTFEIVQISLTLLTILGIVIVKFNDLKHIKESLDKIWPKVDDHSDRISYIEGEINGKKNKSNRRR
jgi:hypothetical protein